MAAHKAKLAKARAKGRQRREKAEIRNAGIGFFGKAHTVRKTAKKARKAYKRVTRPVKPFKFL